MSWGNFELFLSHQIHYSEKAATFNYQLAFLFLCKLWTLYSAGDPFKSLSCKTLVLQCLSENVWEFCIHIFCLNKQESSVVQYLAHCTELMMCFHRNGILIHNDFKTIFVTFSNWLSYFSTFFSWLGLFFRAFLTVYYYTIAHTKISPTWFNVIFGLFIQLTWFIINVIVAIVFTVKDTFLYAAANSMGKKSEKFI